MLGDLEPDPSRVQRRPLRPDPPNQRRPLRVEVLESRESRAHPERGARGRQDRDEQGLRSCSGGGRRSARDAAASPRRRAGSFDAPPAPARQQRPAHPARRGDARGASPSRSPSGSARAGIAVLVDEFQDTDPLQWEIVREAFAERGRTLVLVGGSQAGDLRLGGADVFAYLQAAEEAGSSRPSTSTTAATSRSSTPTTRSSATPSSATRGSPTASSRLPITRSSAARRRRRRCASGSCRSAGTADQPARELTPPTPRKPIADVAADIVGLLNSEAQVREERRTGGTAGEDAFVDVLPRHIAVLVRANRQASA